jgi:hypothetical protein
MNQIVTVSLILAALFLLLVTTIRSFERGRTESQKATVNAAQLLALYEASQQRVSALWEQMARENAERQAARDKERVEFLQKIFELEILVRVYEYRMRAAGIELNVEAHAKMHIAVYRQIVNHLSRDELRTAVFLLGDDGIQWDKLEGETLTSKAQTLISTLERRNLMPRFLHLMRQEFPYVEWPKDAVDGQGQSPSSERPWPKI